MSKIQILFTQVFEQEVDASVLEIEFNRLLNGIENVTSVQVVELQPKKEYQLYVTQSK